MIVTGETRTVVDTRHTQERRGDISQVVTGKTMEARLIGTGGSCIVYQVVESICLQLNVCRVAI